MDRNYSLLHMLQICDSFFPIGAYTLSNGMETYVQKRKLNSSKDLEAYVATYLQILPYNDLGLMVLAYKAMGKEEIIELDSLWAALRSVSEIRKGSERLTSRFIKVFEKIDLSSSLELYKTLINSKKAYGYYPIVVGLFVKDKAINLREATQIYAYSLISNIVTNAVKTVPLSQIEGQKILSESFEKIENAVDYALNIQAEQLGMGATEMEIYAMNHEILYSRIYMS